jgi:hypothetical protein
MNGPARLGVVALAMAAAILPIPEAIVERWYSNGIYARFQPALTTISNLAPVALFDVIAVVALMATIVMIRRRVVSAGWRRGGLTAATTLVTAAAVIYLMFLATWGLNYRRLPLRDKLQFESARLNASATNDLAVQVASEMNRLYLRAHGEQFSIDDLGAAFRSAEASLRVARPTVLGRPKPTIFGGYFHHAAIAGMTDPFFLETLVAPDLLDVERPFVIAHEWGHLAGYADESEANFIAWLACRRGSARAQYSAWLALFGHVYAATGNNRDVFRELNPGPRIDLRAIADRYARTSRIVRLAARETYDRYLRANRVEHGVESYDDVVQLILGTTFDSNGNPQLR